MNLSELDSVSFDSIVVLIHGGLKVRLKFGARWLNLGSHFRKWIQSVSDIAVVNFGLRYIKEAVHKNKSKKHQVRILVDD